ncbi:MAG: hypothetical protein AAFP02_15700, partial [Bacteroidota bacterium]
MKSQHIPESQQEEMLSLNTGRIMLGASVLIAGTGLLSNATYWNLAPSISKLVTFAVILGGIAGLLGSFVSQSFKRKSFEAYFIFYLGLMLTGFCIHLHLFRFQPFLNSAFLYFALITPWFFT